MKPIDFAREFYTVHTDAQHGLVLNTAKEIIDLIPNPIHRDGVLKTYRDALGFPAFSDRKIRQDGETLDTFSTRIIKDGVSIRQYVDSILRLSNSELDKVIEHKEDIRSQIFRIIKIENVPLFIVKSLELLNSTMYNRQLLGLMALTGRKPYELIVSGSLRALNDTSAMFSGQCNSDGVVLDPYPIPTLWDPKKIQQVTIELKEKKQKYLKLTPEELNRAIWKSMDSLAQDAYKWVFPKDYYITMGSAPGAYTAICYELYHPVNMSKKDYLASILGRNPLTFPPRARVMQFCVNDPRTVYPQLDKF